MPTVIDTPELIEHIEHVETHDLTIETREQPQARSARPGFWRTLVQYVTRHRARTLHGTPSSYRVSLHPIEPPADLLARHYPTLYIQAFAGQ